MPMYICRWQNGNFSAVCASSKPDAIQLLSQIGNTKHCNLLSLSRFAIHFALRREPDFGDLLPIEFFRFGDEAEALIERLYPFYAKAKAASFGQSRSEPFGYEQMLKVNKVLMEALFAEAKRRNSNKRADLPHNDARPIRRRRRTE